MQRLLSPCCAPSALPQAVRERVNFALYSTPSTSGRCANVSCRAKSKGRGGASATTNAPEVTEALSAAQQQPQFKGFGQQPKRAPAKQLEFAKEEEPQEEEAAEQGYDTLQNPAYRMYTDAGYAAPRYIGSVEVSRQEGYVQPVLTATTDLLPGELLLVSPALGFVTGDFQQAPESEDLVVSMLEEGLPPPQRRVMALLDEATQPAAAAGVVPPKAAPPSLATLDPKFWAGRGRDSNAPEFNAARLRALLSRTAASDTEQDAAASQARHTKPLGFVGLWPEYALLGHSCAPNTSAVVVGDRLLLHATAEVTRGSPLTRNLLGPGVFAPLEVRRSALEALGVLPPGGRCPCPRCAAEAAAPQVALEAVEAAYEWFTEEASVLWNQANVAEDESALRGLLEEAGVMVSEVEEALEAADKELMAAAAERGAGKDEGGMDYRVQEWLRAGAYDAYDMLVMVDELLHNTQADPEYLQLCLDIIAATTPGTDSHVQVALKAKNLRQMILDNYKALVAREGGSGAKSKKHRRALEGLARQVVAANEGSFEAMLLRYGYQSESLYGQLAEGLETYMDALEQFSVMQAQGVSQLTREMEVDGIRVQVIDRMEVGRDAQHSDDGDAVQPDAIWEPSNDGDDAAGAGALATSSRRQVVQKDGMRFTLMQDDAPVPVASSSSSGRGGASGSQPAAAAAAAMATSLTPGSGAVTGDDDDSDVDYESSPTHDALMALRGEAAAEAEADDMVPELEIMDLDDADLELLEGLDLEALLSQLQEVTGEAAAVAASAGGSGGDESDAEAVLHALLGGGLGADGEEDDGFIDVDVVAEEVAPAPAGAPTDQ